MTIPVAHRAADPGLSAWVSANAGAGKTHVLTDRVTRLLLAGAKPSRILCLTYTKSAAAEMAKRLFEERLGVWALLPDTQLVKELENIGAKDVGQKQLKSARQLFARALETPGGLKIQTIHSFCQHVLARFPVEAGIPTRFQILDERYAAELMKSARNEVLAQAGRNSALGQAIAVLATRAYDRRFGETLDAAMGAERGKLRDVLACHGSDVMRFSRALRDRLGIAEGDDPDTLTASFCNELGLERAQCERVAAWLLSGSKNDVKYGNCLTDFLLGDMSPRVIDCLGNIFLNADGSPRDRLATVRTAEAEPALAAYLEELRDRFVGFNERRKAATTAVLTEALITVAEAVLDSYDAAKRVRAALDYDDLIHHTLQLLEDKDAAQWVLYKLDGGLDHILVDEAQDTSPEQWRIVRKLVEDFFAGRGLREEAGITRTLFAVGDEKQSIFSFQGADPQAFVANVSKMEERAEGAGFVFKRLELEISRRGARVVLDFVDKVFESEAARDGLTFEGGEVRHVPYRKDVVGRVELWPTVKPDPAEEEDAWEAGLAVNARQPSSGAKKLAARIAERIKRLLKEAPVLPATGMAAQAGDIMILVRRRNAFAEEMIRALMERDIPVAGADRMTLVKQIAIMDLVALGHFVLLPGDDLTLASLLRSPLLDLSEDDLFDLAHQRNDTLWAALTTRREERPAFKHAHEFLTARLAEADHVPPFEFYSHVLSRGARKAFVARLGAEAADAIDEFLALALMHESGHAPSLESFLDWFGRGASEVKRDMEQAGQTIRVMTIHGAKGLQAPIVIVPDTTQIPELAARAGLLFSGDCMFFGVNKDLDTQPVRDAKRLAHEAEMREYRRLLYVALTRAQDWLIVCGYEMKKGIRPQSWYPMLRDAAMAIGREETDEAGETILAIGESSFAAGKAIKASAHEMPLPAFLHRPAVPEQRGQRILQPSQVVTAEEPPVFSPFTDEGYRFRRGLLIHSLLAALPNLPKESRAQAARQFLLRRNVADPEAAALAAEALAILDHADFAPLFTPDSRAEVPVSVELPELGPGTRVSGQIDRLAVTADCVLIADYKTNRPPPKNVNEVPALYRAQMALYRAALAKIYPGKRIECALVWTDGPQLMKLPGSLLDAENAQITSRSVG